MGWRPPASAGGPDDALADKVARYEAELIREALTECRGDIRQVTAMLGLPRKTLYDKMTHQGIQPPAHRL